MLELAPHHLVVLPASALAHLRDAVVAGGGDPAPLQQAGYAAGESLYTAFEAWLAARGEPSPDALEFERAQELAGEFFVECGWGDVAVSPLGATVAVDSERWAEATAEAGAAQPSCFVGTGVLAGFFGRLADAPLAVLEVECRSTGAARCRFLLGSADVLDGAYSEMARGVGYLEAVGE